MTVSQYLATLKANPDDDGSDALLYEESLIQSATIRDQAAGLPYVRYFFSPAREWLTLYQKGSIMATQLNLIMSAEKVTTQANPQGAVDTDAISHLFWKTAEIRSLVDEYEFGSLIKGGIEQTGESQPTKQPDGSYKAVRVFEFRYRSI